MIKHINHQNFLTTPVIAAKSWHLHNNNPDDLIILEFTGSEDTITLEYIDYYVDNPIINVSCSIALEQQITDLINYQEGITGSGKFYPDQESTNIDGTFKRLVHTQTKSTFYNKNNDPTKIFGMEFIDFPLGQTFRDISPIIRIFNIPRNIFGERILEKSVRLIDSQLDDNVEVCDDGFQNLIVRKNLFSKIQEVKHFGNFIHNIVPFINAPSHLTASISETASLFDITPVFLSWNDNSTDEVGFKLERTNDGINWGVIATLPENTINFIDTSSYLGMNYSYRILSYNNFIMSSYSNIASAIRQGVIETFDYYSNNQSSNFNSGSGNWLSNWNIDTTTRFVVIDGFEEYPENSSSSFNSGYGWTNMWTILPNVQKYVSIENFEEYPENSSSSFNSGYGWETYWKIE